MAVRPTDVLRFSACFAFVALMLARGIYGGV